MPTNFPGGLDAYARPVSGVARNVAPTETVSFDNAFDSIEALEAKVGVDGSAVTTSLDYKVTRALTAVGAAVYKSGVQTVTSGSQPFISFDTETYDSDGFHDNATNNSRFTVPAGLAGKYHLTIRAEWNANATGVRDVDFYINNTTRYGGDTRMGFATYNSVNIATLVVVLAVGDYVEARAFQDSGTDRNLIATAAGTRFAIQYLGA